jgi:hypothetical protein
MNVRNMQLPLIAAAALIGMAASALWLGTAWKSWPGTLLERAFDRKEAVPPGSLMVLWEKSRKLEQSLLPGTHLHLPGMIGEKLVQNRQIAVARRLEILLEAERVVREALRREPAEPRAWSRLAWLVQFRQGPAAQILAALRMSMYLAPTDLGLLFWRIEAAGVHRASWDAGFEELLKRQIHIGWRVSPARLVKAAKTAVMKDWVRSLLGEHPGDLERFDQLLTKSKK